MKSLGVRTVIFQHPPPLSVAVGDSNSLPAPVVTGQTATSSFRL